MTVEIALRAPAALAGRIEAAISGVAGVRLARVESPDAFAEAIRSVEAVVMPMYLYDRTAAKILREASRLKWFQSLSVGTNRLDDDPLPPHVMVTTAGRTMAVAMAEHAMGLTLALSRQLPRFLRQQSAEVWQPDAREQIRGLVGRTLVITGYGAVGRETAQRARAFGMRVVGVRRRPANDGVAHEVLPMASLDSALGNADVVLAAAPLTRETRGMFDARRFAAMKRGALFLNVSRGALVDTQALLLALQDGQLGGAGLDVVDSEPLPCGHPLWSVPNLVITPHVAASDSDDALAELVAGNIRRYVAGEPLVARYGMED